MQNPNTKLDISQALIDLLDKHFPNDINRVSGHDELNRVKGQLDVINMLKHKKKKLEGG